jgi:hypothetical protein
MKTNLNTRELDQLRNDMLTSATDVSNTTRHTRNSRGQRNTNATADALPRTTTSSSSIPQPRTPPMQRTQHTPPPPLERIPTDTNRAKPATAYKPTQFAPVGTNEHVF